MEPWGQVPQKKIFWDVGPTISLGKSRKGKSIGGELALKPPFSPSHTPPTGSRGKGTSEWGLEGRFKIKRDGAKVEEKKRHPFVRSQCENKKGA